MEFYLLFFGIPTVAALLAWAAAWGQKRRRRETPGPDIDAAARAIRLDAERKRQRWS